MHSLFPLIKKTKKEEKKVDSIFIEKPQITAIVQFFNKRPYLKTLIDRLHNLPIDEIIIIDDGSEDGSIDDMVALLKRKNDFIIRANDLYEVRMYDRAISMARGEFVVLLQDDDLPPKDVKWIRDAISLFQNDPKLLILGGRDGLIIDIPDTVEKHIDTNYSVKGDFAGRPGVNKYQLIRTPRFNVSNIPFEYVMAINRAPMWIKRKCFMEKIGIDQVFAPFQCDDVDSCIKAWINGYHVGLYSANFTHMGKSGMQIFNKNKISKQAGKNWKIIYERYGDIIQNQTLHNKVKSLNNAL